MKVLCSPDCFTVENDHLKNHIITCLVVSFQRSELNDPAIRQEGPPSKISSAFTGFKTPIMMSSHSRDSSNAFLPGGPEIPGAAGGPLQGLTFAAKDLYDVR